MQQTLAEQVKKLNKLRQALSHQPPPQEQKQDQYWPRSAYIPPEQRGQPSRPPPPPMSSQESRQESEQESRPSRCRYIPPEMRGLLWADFTSPGLWNKRASHVRLAHEPLSAVAAAATVAIDLIKLFCYCRRHLSLSLSPMWLRCFVAIAVDRICLFRRRCYGSAAVFFCWP